MARVRQALVAIGGRAQRLRGVPVEVSKAFLPCGPATLLDLCLRSLAAAGIERVLLAFHNEKQHRRAIELIERVDHDLAIEFFRDDGVGVHGIPYQARHRLDESFLFEAGHSVSAPAHHWALMGRKMPGNIVFSAFRPAEGNPRYETVLRDERGTRDPGARRWVLAHPMVVDQEYARRIARLAFDVNRTAAYYDRRRLLEAVASDLPVEFDTYAEYRRVANQLEQNMVGCIHGTPWMERPRDLLRTDIDPWAVLRADDLRAYSTRSSVNSHSPAAFSEVRS